MLKLKDQFKERKEEILEKVISCYLEKGAPIASEFLVMRYKLKISPATIRNEFQKLSKEGYLYKCHISSGRIPTDKALKYFVNKILHSQEVDYWKMKWKERIQTRIEVLKDLEKLTDFIASETKSFSFFYFPKREMIIKKGIKNLFWFLEDEKQESYNKMIEKVAECLDNFDRVIRKIEIDEIPLVLIGRENPLVSVDNLSFIVDKGKLRPVMIGILGYKRMPYHRNIGLLEAVSEFI